MEVKIKKLHPDAKIPYKTYEEDFCYDCVAISCEEVAPNVYKYGLGLAFQIDLKSEVPYILTEQKFDKRNPPHACSPRPAVVSLDFRPRSSVWKTGMVLSNCEGTIDLLFTGGVSAVFYHVMPNMPKYEVGDRIGQIKLGLTLPMNFVEVDKLDETDRGSNAYGSTGR